MLSRAIIKSDRKIYDQQHVIRSIEKCLAKECVVFVYSLCNYFHIGT